MAQLHSTCLPACLAHPPTPLPDSAIPQTAESRWCCLDALSRASELIQQVKTLAHLSSIPGVHQGEGRQTEGQALQCSDFHRHTVMHACTHTCEYIHTDKCEHSTYVCKSVCMHMQSPQRPEDGLELELQAMVGQAWMLGTELWSSGAASTLTVHHLSSLINKGM